MWLNLNGDWKKGRPWINVNGSWKQSTAIWQNVKGVWKKMSFGFYGESINGSLVFKDQPSIFKHRISSFNVTTQDNIIHCTSDSDIKAMEFHVDYSTEPSYERVIFVLDFYFTKDLADLRGNLLQDLNSGAEYNLKISKVDGSKPYILDLKSLGFTWELGVENDFLAVKTLRYAKQSSDPFLYQAYVALYNYLRSNYMNNTDIKIILEAK